MDEIPHVDDNSGGRAHRLNVKVLIPTTTYTGPRGGKRIPIEVVWKASGTGFFRQVHPTCGCTALFPHVRYHNGNNKPRAINAWDWVKQTGFGSVTKLPEEPFNQKLLECKTEREKYGSRLAEIVTSIAEKGGKVTISTK